MEITKTKYKQTEVGLIPEDWNFIKIQSLIDDKVIVSHLDGNHGALYPRSSEFTNNGVPYITANDFLKGYVNFNNIRYLPLSRAEQFQKGIAKNGDVLFAHNATVGPSAVLETKLDYVILSTTATYYRTDNKKLNNYYLRYFFESEFFLKQYSAVMRQSTRNQIPITQQRKFSIILPSTLTEQKAISTAIKSVDYLITNLDKLFTKKKAIKQGVMQQLLSPPHKGGKRLAGFTGEWKGESIKDFAKISTGGGDTQDRNDDGIYPFYVRSNTVERINTYSFDGEAILTSGDGVGVGKIFHYVNEKFDYHQRVYNIHNYRDDILGKYLFYQFSSRFYERVMTMTAKSSVDSVRREMIADMEIPLPPSREEQISIVKVLDAINDELEILGRKRKKYQSIKQGMLQELLTGKTRLV
jgi:type I restriction enzyme, S subunit